jgi:hypothetical protein
LSQVDGFRSFSTLVTATQSEAARNSDLAGKNELILTNDLARNIELIRRIREAAKKLADIEKAWDYMVEKARAENKDILLSDLQKQEPDAWQAVESAQAAHQVELEVLSTTVKLLSLQAERANEAIRYAKAKLDGITEKFNAGLATEAEREVERANLRDAEIAFEQVTTVLDELTKASGLDGQR